MGLKEERIYIHYFTLINNATMLIFNNQRIFLEFRNTTRRLFQCSLCFHLVQLADFREVFATRSQMTREFISVAIYVIYGKQIFIIV